MYKEMKKRPKDALHLCREAVKVRSPVLCLFFWNCVENCHEIRPLLVIPPSFSRNKIAKLYKGNREFEVVRDTHEALRRSEFAFICSGTATLEAALIGTPFTLAYIAKKVDFFIGTKLLGITQVGLANIILTHYNNTTLHNELLQEEVTVDNLLKEYYNTDRKIFAQKAEELKTYLSHGSSENVAKIIMEYIMLVHICCSVDSHYFLKKLQTEYPEEKLTGFLL